MTEGYIHRHSAHQDELVSSFENVKTLYENIKRSVTLFTNNNCLGTRKFLKDGTRGDYEFISYKQYWDKANALGSSLRNLGIKPEDKLASYSINREEISITDAASIQQGYVSVSLYDTLGEGSVEYILKHADVVAVVCTRDKTKRLLSVAPNLPKLKYIIQFEDWSRRARYGEGYKSQDPDYSSELQKLPNIKILEYQDLLLEGTKLPVLHQEPKPEDIAMILYTSGTTGDPKGVVISHKNFVSAIAAAKISVPQYPGDVHLSYLPFAHVYERIVMATGLACGGTSGYYQGDITKLTDDVATLKPTVFVGVPRVFQKIYDRVNQTITEALWHRRKLFSYAFNSKVEALSKGQQTPWLDSMVFAKIRDRLGGRIRLIISGSAPLSPTLQQFLRVCFCCPVIQGYGLSETCALTTVQHVNDVRSGHVGNPCACSEIKLISVPDMDYTVEDKPLARGEICIRGNSVFQGYFREPEKTAEVFTPDGFFKTGDIGQWNPDGTLSIVDRKKNIFKLAQGEYVAAEKLEGVYSRSKFISQIFVYGDSFQNYLVGVVVPEQEFLVLWAKSAIPNEKDYSLAALVKHPRVKELIRQELDSEAERAHLNGFEVLKEFFLEHSEFVQETGLITPTFKLVRGKLKSHYENEIKEMYAKGTGSATKSKL